MFTNIFQSKCFCLRLRNFFTIQPLILTSQLLQQTSFKNVNHSTDIHKHICFVYISILVPEKLQSHFSTMFHKLFQSTCFSTASSANEETGQLRYIDAHRFQKDIRDIILSISVIQFFVCIGGKSFLRFVSGCAVCVRDFVERDEACRKQQLIRYQCKIPKS